MNAGNVGCMRAVAVGVDEARTTSTLMEREQRCRLRDATLPTLNARNADARVGVGKGVALSACWVVKRWGMRARRGQEGGKRVHGEEDDAG
jgi:hypothetical protein